MNELSVIEGKFEDILNSEKGSRVADNDSSDVGELKASLSDLESKIDDMSTQP